MLEIAGGIILAVIGLGVLYVIAMFIIADIADGGGFVKGCLIVAVCGALLLWMKLDPDSLLWAWVGGILLFCIGCYYLAKLIEWAGAKRELTRSGVPVFQVFPNLLLLLIILAVILATVLAIAILGNLQ